MLYASRTPEDVLCVDELREAEAQAPDRIRVRHTLTDWGEGGVEAAQPRARDDPSWLPGRHYHFTSQWNPFKPAKGPLQTAEGAEAGLRGRPDRAMLAEQLPPPSDTTAVLVCGPPNMWEAMRAALLELGHAEENLVELKALSATQLEERAAAQAAAGETAA